LIALKKILQFKNTLSTVGHYYRIGRRIQIEGRLLIGRRPSLNRETPSSHRKTIL